MKFNDIENRMTVAMRTALRKHEKAKLWAKANSEDTFCLVAYRVAYDAMMDIAVAKVQDDTMAEWLNQNLNDRRLREFILPICREMYSYFRTC